MAASTSQMWLEEATKTFAEDPAAGAARAREVAVAEAEAQTVAVRWWKAVEEWRKVELRWAVAAVAEGW